MTTDPNQTNQEPVLRPYKNAYTATLDEPDDVPNENTDTSVVDPALAATNPQNPDNPQEATYKKRYDDLKRHYDKTVTVLRSDVTDLKKQLTLAVNKEINLPSTPDEVEAWAKEYPNVYAVVRTIAIREANERSKAVDERVQEVEKQSVELKTERTLFEVRKAHPDFDALCQSQEFHDWLTEQPKEIQGWLYDNYSNPSLAIRAIDLYRVEHPNKPVTSQARTRAEIAKDAAKNPSGTSAQEQPTGQKKVWKTSDIKKLRPHEFEKYEAEIDRASREGRVVEG